MNRAVRTRNWLGGFFGWVWLAVIIVPLYYIVITSIRPQSAFFTENPLSIPSRPTLESYALVLQNNFMQYLVNSLIVTVATVFVVLVVCLMASYAIVRNTSRRVSRIFAVFLLGLAIPLQATIIPIYWMITELGLYDTLFALILPSIAFAIPITILIMVNFIRDIPGELFESMKVDGASNWRILWILVLPLARPALATVGIYDSLAVWNGFLFPLVLTQSPNIRVLPLSLQSYQGEFASNIPAILAAVVLSAVPILAAYLVGRRQLISGLTAGFGK